VLVVAFLLVPLGMAFWISTQRYESLGSPVAIGAANFLGLARDAVFWESLLNTVVFTVATVPTGMALGLGIATLLNSVLPARAFFRSVVFLPLVIAGVSVGMLGAWIFDQYDGFVNNVLGALGITGPSWQSEGAWAMVAIVLVTLWIRVGFDMIVYLAALQGIDPQLTEAAQLDGAGAWRRFTSVVWPQLRPATFFLVVMNLIYSFQVFDTVFAMTTGGPDNATTMVVTYAYRVGFDEHGPGQLGYAAAVGVVIFAISMLFTVFLWRRNAAEEQS
jgi:multiple sugar transport system permease protein